MDINKIIAMNNYGKEVKQRYDEMFNENKEDRLDLLNKSIEKINKTFNDILDAIEGHVIYVKVKGVEFKLRNVKGNRYATVEFKYDELLLSTNNTGEACRYNKTGYPDDIYYKHYRVNSSYNYKNAFTDFYLTNKEEIEEAIFKEIKKEMNEAIEENVKKIQCESAYLLKMQEFIG